jgi:hypothetical protein
MAILDAQEKSFQSVHLKIEQVAAQSKMDSAVTTVKSWLKQYKDALVAAADGHGSQPVPLLVHRSLIRYTATPLL